MAGRRPAYRRRQSNRLGMFMVTVAVLMLLAVVSVKSVELNRKLDGYKAREAVLEEQIAAEKRRKAEIEDFQKYTQTKAYKEEVAKDKLGLVNKGEIVFKEKE